MLDILCSINSLVILFIIVVFCFFLLLCFVMFWYLPKILELDKDKTETIMREAFKKDSTKEDFDNSFKETLINYLKSYYKKKD